MDVTFRLSRLAALLLTLLCFGPWASGVALAHSFRVALVAPGGPDSDAVLASAYRGFRLATRERDGHANEESDGHLGGLDVYIGMVEFSAEAAAARTPGGEVGAAAPDIVVAIGVPAELAPLRAAGGGDAVLLEPGKVPNAAAWRQEPTLGGAAGSFQQRFSDAYGSAPDGWAAQGYDAARRIDLAIRPLGGVADRAALTRGLAATQGGIRW
ncbi:MAG: hypothetical protein RH942_19590 [Kiloniellaceae bacterium]